MRFPDDVSVWWGLELEPQLFHRRLSLSNPLPTKSCKNNTKIYLYAMSTNPLKTFVLYKFKNYPFIVILTLSLVFADFDLSLSFSLLLSLSLILCPCHIINRYSHSHAQFSTLK